MPRPTMEVISRLFMVTAAGGPVRRRMDFSLLVISSQGPEIGGHKPVKLQIYQILYSILSTLSMVTEYGEIW